MSIPNAKGGLEATVAGMASPKRVMMPRRDAFSWGFEAAYTTILLSDLAGLRPVLRNLIRTEPALQP